MKFFCKKYAQVSSIRLSVRMGFATWPPLTGIWISGMYLLMGISQEILLKGLAGFLFLLPIPLRRAPLHLPKSLGEIAHLLKAALHPNIADFPVRALQQFRSPLNAQLFDILHGRAANDAPEAPQAFTFADTGAPGDLRQGDFFAVAGLDVLEHSFGPLPVPQGLFRGFLLGNGTVLKQEQDEPGQQVPGPLRR